MKCNCGHEVDDIEDVCSVTLPTKRVSLHEDRMVNAITYVGICKRCYET